LMPVKPKKKKK